MKSLVSIIFLLSVHASGEAQSIKTIEIMSGKHQACLDSGIDMLGCSKHFYYQMDSMLNIVYSKLKTSLNVKEKAELKKEQLAWLKKRDIYFAKQDKIFRTMWEKGEWGKDMDMVTYHNCADYVKVRVVTLLKRLDEK